MQELTRKVVEDFVSEIKFYAPDRIEVIFNFADEYDKIAPLFEKPKAKRKDKAVV